ncbi:hypothetical protein EZV62_003355 [Acer yangbiense]|uniref:Reverse transcriptase Ty1/copia-type domain-containing protein n=1 Tax=Acer yangbiense TaxID=1000413 RepID=A0A5C7IGG6_9ROSI|nr:hypothetical protein EZV62_003355 [Acer yangbiense]
MIDSKLPSTSERNSTRTKAGFEVEQQDDQNDQQHSDADLIDHSSNQPNDYLGDEEVYEEQDDLNNYQLVRDRARREHRAPVRYGYADLISFALTVAEDINENEPRNFNEAVRSKPRVFLLLYVDDMLIASSDITEIRKLKGQLSMEFEMKDLGAAKRILGMNISRDRRNNSLFVSQEDYIQKVLRRFGMTDSKVENLMKMTQLESNIADMELLSWKIFFRSFLAVIGYNWQASSSFYILNCLDISTAELVREV